MALRESLLLLLPPLRFATVPPMGFLPHHTPYLCMYAQVGVTDVLDILDVRVPTRKYRV